MGYDRDHHDGENARKGMKDIKFEDWRLTVFWVAVAVATGIAGFVFGWCWRERPGALASVSVLDAMTAVGTVGATSVALYFGLSSQKRDMEARKERLTSVLHLVEEAVESAKWVAGHLGPRSNPRVREISPLARHELSAFFASMDAVNRIPFHEPHFSEAHSALIQVLGALRSYSPLVSTYLDGPDDGGVSPALQGLSETLVQNLDVARMKEPFKDLPSLGRLYF